MARHVIAYLMDGAGVTPDYVEYGGGQFNVGDEMVGISVEDTERYLPSTVTKLTKAELITRLQDLGIKRFSDSHSFTDQEISDMVDQYLSDNGLPDYA